MLATDTTPWDCNAIRSLVRIVLNGSTDTLISLSRATPQLWKVNSKVRARDACIQPRLHQSACQHRYLSQTSYSTPETDFMDLWTKVDSTIIPARRAEPESSRPQTVCLRGLASMPSTCRDYLAPSAWCPCPAMGMRRSRSASKRKKIHLKGGHLALLCIAEFLHQTLGHFPREEGKKNIRNSYKIIKLGTISP